MGTTAEEGKFAQAGITRAEFVKGGMALFGGVLMATLAGCGSSGSGSTDSSSSDSSKADYTLITDGTLTIAGDCTCPPMLYMDGTNTVGFEADMIQAMADKMGLTVTWLPTVKFDTLIPMIKQGGKADLSISSFSITDERKKEIDFTDSYMDANTALVTRKDSPNQTTDSLNVAGMKVAAEAGTTSEAWIQENLPNATCVPVDDDTGLMTGIQSGLYDGGMMDQPMAVYMCKVSFQDLQVSQTIPTGGQYGIVVSKDNPGLTKALNKALADIRADGTWDSLYDKWLGESS